MVITEMPAEPADLIAKAVQWNLYEMASVLGNAIL